MGKRSGKEPGDSFNSREIHTLFHLKAKVHPPLTVTVEVDKVKLCMEVDTGAAVSIISESTHQRLWPEEARPSLQRSAVLYGHTLEKNCRLKVRPQSKFHTVVGSVR